MSKYFLNFQSAAAYREESIEGREHVIIKVNATTLPSVMHGVLYPADVVSASASLLTRKPVPLSHPPINDGVAVSASDPLFLNKASFGAFVHSAEVKGNMLVAEIAIDKEVANRTEMGRKELERVYNNELIAVSTGVIAQVEPEAGDLNGDTYSEKITKINFDHLAWLPAGEAPAGKDCTRLFNKNPKGTYDMEKLLMFLRALADSPKFTLFNSDIEKSIDDTDALVKLVCNSVATPAFELADALSLVGKELGIEADEASLKAMHNAAKEFDAHKEQFAEFVAARKAQLEALREKVLSNSKLRAEVVESLDLADLEVLAADLTAKDEPVNTNAVRLNSATVLPTKNNEVTVSYE